MPKARNGAVELEFETFGDDRPETVLLVNGLGSQMTRWPVDFCEKLVARGYRAIRFDNRDTGLSTWPTEPYVLADMANDAMAVLDAAGVARAHIAGVSMGGMIVQRMAIDHPDRVRSMTSIMSAPSPATLTSTPEAAAVLNVAPPDPKADHEAFIAHVMRNNRTIGSPAYPWTEAELRERAEGEYRRAFNPPGVVRQRRAIMADGDRVPALKQLKIPTVVLHGTDDPLVQPIGGETTAAAIPGAELRMIPGMGHDLPPGLHEIFADAICAAAARAKA
ncbi:MAG: alpha/beta fold hydrolase [Alphaproteobacteria bacterium]|nr:alpha/beta fold hydrolase [Alphaproteobacteria bacterium]MBU1515123.1 alpha/beta fold hydrolase [Alphaproteobacteria bacterium]MBU2093481.1 alpha/beta fold hydrolase [Alphaproteobacteria bacterium]MBU2152329.1 alpha/beta fold hydrolase [Alphaproteobacteria bacterium]MBU2308143.1 alpha/beta fold hydrolase [Alphaproteobacteria bacterium]